MHTVLLVKVVNVGVDDWWTSDDDVLWINHGDDDWLTGDNLCDDDWLTDDNHGDYDWLTNGVCWLKSWCDGWETNDYYEMLYYVNL